MLASNGSHVRLRGAKTRRTQVRWVVAGRCCGPCWQAPLGVLAGVLISCGGSGKGLIPAADAGPLQGDFEAVAQAAENGDGSARAPKAHC